MPPGAMDEPLPEGPSSRTGWVIVALSAALVVGALVIGQPAPEMPPATEGAADGEPGSEEEAAQTPAPDVLGTATDEEPFEEGVADLTRSLDAGDPADDPCLAPLAQLPTPLGVSRGQTWRQLVGASPEDFPGPAAVVGGPSLGPDIVLGDPPRCGADALPSATVVAGPEPTVTAALTAGASLVVVDPAEPAMVPALAEELARHRCRAGTVTELAVASAPDALPSAGLALLDSVDGDLVIAANRLLRSGGQRALLRDPQVSPAILARHLIHGGGVWLEGPLPSEHAAVLAFARRHRRLFGVSTARVALVHASRDVSGLVRPLARLEAARVQFDVIHDPSLPGRLERYERRVLSDDVGDAELATLVSVEPTPPGAPLLLPPVVAGDLPPSVFVERRKVPGDNLLVHHFVNPGAPIEGVVVDVPAWVEALPDVCAARWYAPDTDEVLELPCASGEERVARVALPRLGTWGILTTGPVLAETPAQSGPITLTPEDGMPGSMSLQARVPGWPAEVGEITLFVPETFTAAANEITLGAAFAPTFEVMEGGTHLTGTGRDEQVQLDLDVRAGTDTLDLTLAVTNRSSDLLPDVRALVCLESKPAGVFPREGHDRTWTPGLGVPLAALPEDVRDPFYREIEAPWYGLTMVQSIDERWTMGHAFESSTVAGGNAGRTHLCLHSRPMFGDLAPGETVARKGRIYLARDGIDGVAARYEAAPLDPLPPRPPGVAPSVPCR